MTISIRTNNKNFKEHTDYKNLLNNVMHYTPDFFNKLQRETISDMLELAIEKKNYFALKHILYNGIKHDNNSNYQLLNPLSTPIYGAIENIDKDAIAVIVNFINDPINSYFKNVYAVNSCMWGKIYAQDPMEDQKDPQLQKDIFLSLLSIRTNETIKMQDLNILSSVVSKAEFDQFIENKNINITTMLSGGLDLVKYKYEDAKPVIAVDDASSKYLLGFLLNSTYSDTISAEDISTMYHTIYNTSDDAKLMLTYVSALVATGNPIKIIFDQDLQSSYYALEEIIRIDSKFLNESMSFISSILSHEINHYIYHQAFANNIKPFNIKELKESGVKIKELIDSLEHEEAFWINYKTVFATISKELLSDNSSLFRAIDIYYQYKIAAKEPLAHAAKLLQINSIAANDTYSWAEHLKFNSDIDVFLFQNKFILSEKSAHNNMQASDSEYITLSNAYFKHMKKPHSFNKSEIVTWAKEDFCPELIKQLNLSNEQVYFLERISDLVNRAQFLTPNFEGTCYIGDDNNAALDVELMVRMLELNIVIGNEAEIMQSFAGLNKYHQEHVKPVLCEFLIANSNISSLPFSGETNNTNLDELCAMECLMV
jgi:hypothetical protein